MDASAIKELSRANAITEAEKSVDVALNDRGVCALPSDFAVNDLEKYMPTRRRLRGNMTTPVVTDFCSYATKNAEDGATIFIDPDKMSAVAVLNFGTPDVPGHTDNTVTLELKRTAAYDAMRKIATGNALAQVSIAEFLEDWADCISCFNESGEMQIGKAVASVRKITINELKKTEIEVKQLSASKSAFESVQADSASDPLPTTIRFKCKPYSSLPERDFDMRLGVLTSNDKPAINLRIIKVEEHEEQMAEELSQCIVAELGINVMPVILGKYFTK